MSEDREEIPVPEPQGPLRHHLRLGVAGGGPDRRRLRSGGERRCSWTMASTSSPRARTPSGIGMKNFSPTYRTLGDYEVKKRLCRPRLAGGARADPDDLVQIAWEDVETEEEVENIVEVIDSARGQRADGTRPTWSSASKGDPMSILHTVNKSPFERNSLESCLKFAARRRRRAADRGRRLRGAAGTSVAAQVADALDSLRSTCSARTSRRGASPRSA